MTPQRWDDERLERIIGNILRWGVIAAAAVVVFGGVLYMVRHGAEAPQYGVFRGEPEDLRGISGILAGVLKLHGRSVIQLGLLLLIATPVARVAFSMVGFAVQRDRLYVLLTGIVLALLTFSLAGGN